MIEIEGVAPPTLQAPLFWTGLPHPPWMQRAGCVFANLMNKHVAESQHAEMAADAVVAMRKAALELLKKEEELAISKEMVDRLTHTLARRDEQIVELKKDIAFEYNYHGKHAALNWSMKNYELKREHKEEAVKTARETEARRKIKEYKQKYETKYLTHEQSEQGCLEKHDSVTADIRAKFEKKREKLVGRMGGEGGGQTSKLITVGAPKPEKPKRSLPTTPRCRFISDIAPRYNREKKAAEERGKKDFPGMFEWVKPLWEKLPAEEKAPYERAFAEDTKAKAEAEANGEVWVNPAKKQKVVNGGAAVAKGAETPAKDKAVEKPAKDKAKDKAKELVALQKKGKEKEKKEEAKKEEAMEVDEEKPEEGGEEGAEEDGEEGAGGEEGAEEGAEEEEEEEEEGEEDDEEEDEDEEDGEEDEEEDEEEEEKGSGSDSDGDD